METRVGAQGTVVQNKEELPSFGHSFFIHSFLSCNKRPEAHLPGGEIANLMRCTGVRRKIGQTFLRWHLEPTALDCYNL